MALRSCIAMRMNEIDMFIECYYHIYESSNADNPKDACGEQLQNGKTKSLNKRVNELEKHKCTRTPTRTIHKQLEHMPPVKIPRIIPPMIDFGLLLSPDGWNVAQHGTQRLPGQPSHGSAPDMHSIRCLLDGLHGLLLAVCALVCASFFGDDAPT
jgi:hypothetical protein